MKQMSVIELQPMSGMAYDISGPKNLPASSLCSSCKIKGKSFLCLVIKKAQYPVVRDCTEHKLKYWNKTDPINK